MVNGEWGIANGQWSMGKNSNLIPTLCVLRDAERRQEHSPQSGERASVLSTVHFPLFTFHFPLFTVHCSLSTVHFPLSPHGQNG